MNKRRTYLFAFVSIFIALTLACSFSASTAKVAEAFTARDVNGVHEATKVFSQDEIFYLLVTLQNAPDDTVTKAVWYAVDAEGTEKNTLIDEAEFTSSDQEITFNLSNDQLWPVGTYKVEIFINDKLKQTLEFSVEGGVTTASNSSGAVSYDAYMVSKAGGGVTKTDVYTTDEPFYLIIDLTSAPADIVSKAVWYAANVTDVAANTLIDEAEIQSNGEITFDLSNDGPWPTGTYKVEVYINNVLDQTVQFTVADNSGSTGGTTSGSGTVKVINAYTAREVNGNFEKTEVYSSDEAFHCVVELSEASPNAKIKADWIAIEVEGLGANSSLYSNEGSSNTKEMVFDLSNNNPWPTGKYGVQIYLDGAAQGSVEFNVE